MTRRRDVADKKDKLLRENLIQSGMQQEIIQIIEHADSRQIDLILRIARKITASNP